MLSEFKNAIQKAKGAAGAIKTEIDTATSKALELSAEAIALEESQIFLQQVAQSTQNQLRIHIQDIVQLALDTCFPGEYEFCIEFEIKRGKTEAAIVFKKDGQPIDPMTSTGGGAIDITAFALRIASWTLSRTRNTIILDEPFRFLSADLQPRAAEIMKELSDRLKLQFLVVTHSPTIVDVADRVFTVEKKGDYSIVKRTEL